jgi:uncharacterized protein
MTASTNSSAQTLAPVPWWKVPHMWLVVGGPLVVVIAAIVTAVIAVRGADPVLNKEQFERDLKEAQSLTGQAKAQALVTLQPAQQARNHAASPLTGESPEGK